MMVDSVDLTGGCNCGAVRYRVEGAPLVVAACHCTQCRRQSGAAYSVNLVVRAKTMTVEGDLASWTDTDTESGTPLARQYCASCGSPIRSAPSAAPGIFALKAGTLDDPAPFAPTLHLWTASKLPWVTIPDGVLQFERGAPA
jgi:hypothetical protein